MGLWVAAALALAIVIACELATRCQLEWKPQDCWVGLFCDVRWGTVEDWPYDNYQARFLHVWVCLIPMVPLHLTWRWGNDVRPLAGDTTGGEG